MVRRIFVEKKPGLDAEARTLLAEARGLLGIGSLESVRILNRYDVEDISTELFEYAVRTVFSEPQLDEVLTSPSLEGAMVFAVEYLPGQFDQRADSAAQCIQILSQGERPPVRSAKVYALYGKLSEDELAEIKKYVINPVEAREASMELPESLALQTGKRPLPSLSIRRNSSIAALSFAFSTIATDIPMNFSVVEQKCFSTPIAYEIARQSLSYYFQECWRVIFKLRHRVRGKPY